MPYATFTDVALEFKLIDFTSSAAAVKSSTVDEWCTEASNYIDAGIAGKYQVPVDPTNSPKSFSVLKTLCIRIVVPRVASAVGTQTGIAKNSQTPGGNGKGAGGTDPMKAIDDKLSKIQSGAMKLPDAVIATTQDGVESFTSDNPQCLSFRRNKRNW